MDDTDLLAHRLDGDGETVLFLNGGMMTIAAWEPITAPIAERFRVLRCDFRGQVQSPGPPHRELGAHVQDVVRLLDHLELDRVHVVGASFGGEVGLLLASTAPERLRSIVVITASDAMTDSFREGSERMRRVIADIVAGGDRGPFHDVMVDDVFSEAYVEAHRDELELRRERLSLLPVPWFEGVDAILECTEYVDLRPRLADVTAPALVVIAGGDRVMPPERSRALAAALGAEVEEKPESGHALVTEYPEWTTETCLAFLERQAR